MLSKKHILVLTGLLMWCAFAKAQEPKDPEDTIIAAEEVEVIATKEAYDPLRPAKAAFYAAVLPGMGQVYNKDYWKVPLVYGALGSSIYAVGWNSQRSERFRTAYKERLAGRIDEFTVEVEGSPGEFREVFSDEALIRGQNQFRRTRDLMILVSAGVYILQIIEANVDAHLSQYNVDDDLTFQPDMYFDDFQNTMNFGAKLTYKF